jgi:hypothetical protein
MPFDPHSHRPVVFKNNSAVVLWLFMAVWMAVLVSCSTNFETGSGLSAWAIAGLVLMWVLSLAFTALALWVPKVRIEISPDGVFVREHALLWKRDRRFIFKDLTVSNIVKGDDDEGVNYSCSLLLPGKESIVVAQSGSLLKVERIRNELMAR